MSDRQRCQYRHQRAGIALPRRLAALALAASAALSMNAVQAQGQAQPQDAEDGIRVQRGGASIRQIVPVEVIEQQASQEYEQLKEEAQAKKTLAGDNNPQLVRLRAIAKRILPQTPRWTERAKQWKSTPSRSMRSACPAARSLSTPACSISSS